MTEITEYGERSSGVVLIQMIDRHDLESMEREYALIRERTDRDFLLRAYTVKNWNTDLSPWKAPAVFGKEDFGTGAEDTLQRVLADCSDTDVTYYIGGYSLAGLFALWSAYRTRVFAGAACASPSLWFPGFTDYMREHKPGSRYIYLSLGDREDKTRNPVMATVSQRIREAREILCEQGAECILEWNEGNHFRDPEERCAKAFAWVLQSGPVL